MTQPDRSKLPIRRAPFRGVANRTLDGSQPDWARSATSMPRRGAERPGGADRRRRVRQPGDVRRADRHAELHADGGGGPAVQPLPRHRAVLADARGAADRPQQPRRRLRLGRRVLDRLPGLYGVRSGRLRAVPEDPAGQRLQHRGVRQVAPDAGRPAGPGRAVQPLAGRLGLRLLLRVPRRRLGAVGSVPGREPEDHRHSRRRFYDEEEPYYLPDDMADKTIEWLHAIRAQDADKPFFAYFSTGCSHAPHHVVRGSGRRSTRASSTRAGTGCARRRSPGRRRSA